MDAFKLILGFNIHPLYWLKKQPSFFESILCFVFFFAILTILFWLWRSAKVKQSATDDGRLSRRKFVKISFSAWLVLCATATVRFFFPPVNTEPSPRFSIGYPSDFPLGVSTKFVSQYRIWVVRDSQKLFVILANCTHLGCTPDWNEAEYKFKCPCHGSGFDAEGVNFEGPAPRPLDRLLIQQSPDGSITVDKSVLFASKQDWEKPDAFLML